MAFGLVDAFGIVGLVMLLTGFLGNLWGRVPASGALYGWLNCVGSGILTVYSAMIRAWVFFPLELIWAVAAGVSLARRRSSRGAR